MGLGCYWTDIIGPLERVLCSSKNDGEVELQGDGKGAGGKQEKFVFPNLLCGVVPNLIGSFKPDEINNG